MDIGHRSLLRQTKFTACHCSNTQLLCVDTSAVVVSCPGKRFSHGENTCHVTVNIAENNSTTTSATSVKLPTAIVSSFKLSTRAFVHWSLQMSSSLNWSPVLLWTRLSWTGLCGFFFLLSLIILASLVPSKAYTSCYRNYFFRTISSERRCATGERPYYSGLLSTP